MKRVCQPSPCRSGREHGPPQPRCRRRTEGKCKSSRRLTEFSQLGKSFAKIGMRCGFGEDDGYWACFASNNAMENALFKPT